MTDKSNQMKMVCMQCRTEFTDEKDLLMVHTVGCPICGCGIVELSDYVKELREKH